MAISPKIMFLSHRVTTLVGRERQFFRVNLVVSGRQEVVMAPDRFVRLLIIVPRGFSRVDEDA